MSRFLVFIGVALGIVASIHYYIWARLVRDTHLPSPWNVVASVGLVVLAGSMPAALALGRARPALGRVLAWPAYVWMGTMFLLLVALAASDLARLVAWSVQRAAGAAAVDQQRRTLLARLAAGVVMALSGGMAAAALRSALGPVSVRDVKVRLPRLPRGQHGTRIVQITDVHIGPTIGRAFIEEIVRRTNALEPDVVAITGDLVDGSVAELRDAVAPLAGLRARHGVFFVTGNHEYFSGAVEWMSELPRLGIRVLRNERVSIGDGAASFDLAGVDDRTAGRYGGLAPRAAIEQALAGRDASRELVLLAHQPSSFFDAVPFGVGLQLSGHTHGGQLWPFSYIVRLVQPFLAGLHRQGASQIYVSRGTGYWGPPMRLGAPAEITHFELQSEERA
jgi:predicted MPP superfamily phosphohydrolase